MTSLTFSKINGLNKRNPSNTAMLYSHGGSEAGTASLSLCHNIHSSDATAIVAHSKGQFRTMGFCFLYAVKGDEVVSLMKRGHFAQRDVKGLIAEGFTEFFYSDCYTCKTYMLPSGAIVTLRRSIDCSPVATTTEALRFGRTLGVV